jgi:hypothetical protein
MVAANTVFTRLAEIAECLCAEIKNPAWDVPDVCFCGVVPGEALDAAYGGDCTTECGMAWVRLDTGYPSTTIGQLYTEAGNCTVPLGFDIELGIMRCIEVGDGLEGPTQSQLLAASQLQIADLLIMQRAIYCCGTLPNKEIIVGPYLPAGPLGGLVGGSIRVSVGSL